MNVLIIGTGPASWATCNALIEKGVRPTVWDVGNKLDENHLAFKENLKEKTTHSLTPSDAFKLYTKANIRNGEFPKKRLYGSDYFHGFNQSYSPLISKESLIAPTFAQGGFAVGWGGAMLPIRNEDMANWPITASDLSPHFKRVLQNLPLALGSDNSTSTEVFPLFKDIDSLEFLPISLRLQRLQQRLDRNQPDDKCQVARLALYSKKENACNLSGLCLTGCPQNSIYSFSDCFEKWHTDGKINLCRDRLVYKIEEDDQGVAVKYITGAEKYEERFGRIFLAAGAISSTRIVLESLNKFEVPVKLLDSQKFIMPMFQLRGGSTPTPTFELPSLFWDLQKNDHWLHIQINEAGRFTKEHLPGLVPNWLRSIIINRMLIGWGGLHSDHSQSFKLSLLRAHRQGRPIFHVEPIKTTKITTKLIRRLTKELANYLSKAGVYTSPLLTQIAPPGGGFHFGGSLTMTTKRQTELETDTLGRLPAWKSVHIVDGSILPSIPATTIALNIMANADRITCEVLKN
ncbi:MAG: hypothetical protein V7776_15725 [Halopseudomonas aestusnigri]